MRKEEKALKKTRGEGKRMRRGEIKISKTREERKRREVKFRRID